MRRRRAYGRASLQTLTGVITPNQQWLGLLQISGVSDPDPQPVVVTNIREICFEHDTYWIHINVNNQLLKLGPHSYGGESSDARKGDIVLETLDPYIVAKC